MSTLRLNKVMKEREKELRTLVVKHKEVIKLVKFTKNI